MQTIHTRVETASSEHVATVSFPEHTVIHHVMIIHITTIIMAVMVIIADIMMIMAAMETTVMTIRRTTEMQAVHCHGVELS